MYTQDEKTSDLVLEEFADFGIRITLEDVQTQCTPHPITGDPTNCVDTYTPTNLTGAIFTADVVDTLEDSGVVLGSFNFTVVGDPSAGVVDMTMSAAAIDTISASGGVRDAYDKRLRHVGFYDVTILNGGVTTRIFQGKILVSDGATA